MLRKTLQLFTVYYSFYSPSTDSTHSLTDARYSRHVQQRVRARAEHAPRTCGECAHDADSAQPVLTARTTATRSCAGDHRRVRRVSRNSAGSSAIIGEYGERSHE